ncbi:hypothetical protein CRG98_017673 [Punica granatum]|uniref:Uncharacterized protein n=1 Tax=Punica granatum TaxID=22663 RepID=A0A2I0K052_PUNGR|nr:hypothetical protein CRG98_017673 [Punica granatum]
MTKSVGGGHGRLGWEGKGERCGDHNVDHDVEQALLGARNGTGGVSEPITPNRFSPTSPAAWPARFCSVLFYESSLKVLLIVWACGDYGTRSAVEGVEATL